MTRSLFADLDTPVSTYLKVGNVPYTYLLESVQGGDKWGRYSFIGLPAQRIFKVEKYQVSNINCLTGEAKTLVVEDPLDYIREQNKELSIPPALPELLDLPRFCGGLVGYFAYECAAYTESRLRHLLDKDDGVGCPQIVLMHSDDIIAFDNLLGKMMLISYADLSSGELDLEGIYKKTQTRLNEMENMLASPLPDDLAKPLALHGKDSDDNLQQLLSDDAQSQGDEYRDMVRKVKEYVHAGDAMQIVPSQRMEIAYPCDAFDFYRALRTVNPAPYMFYLHLDAFMVAGASPEILSRLEYRSNGDSQAVNGIATVRPIAGTRPRGKNKQEDDLLQQEMLKDPKEIAEHLMLIDLGRNDIGKVSKIGSVKVSDQFGVEKYSHVMHMVSNVTGELKEELDALDLLKSSLPAGTLSGTPKIRAMEIIAELEDSKRGIYGGALGYLGWQGNMDMCIAIRTAIIKQGKLFLQAGGGIVADSDENAEWHETLNKRGALLRVADMLGLSDTMDTTDDS